MDAIGYLRASTEDQGLGLEAQRATVTAEIKRRGWDLVEVIEDADESGRDTKRPGLRRALELIAAGEVEALVVAKMDRLSRSSMHTGQLLDWFMDAGATFVAPDLGVDTSTASGSLVAGVLAEVAQWERKAIAERTSAALQAKKAKGEAISGPTVKPEVRRRIERQRRFGWTYQRIASALNADGIKTARGGKEWRPSNVGSVLGRRPTRRRRRLPAELPSLDGRRHGNNRRKVTA